MHWNQTGSPPQVRGKHIINFQFFGNVRITPAGAGKTTVMREIIIDNWDHPRRCGENAEIPAVIIDDEGSPPQVRGKQIRTAADWYEVRITPAGAGKTCGDDSSCGLHWDHPRRCGENREVCIGIKHYNGSPPQVRGKPCRIL